MHGGVTQARIAAARIVMAPRVTNRRYLADLCGRCIEGFRDAVLVKACQQESSERWERLTKHFKEQSRFFQDRISTSEDFKAWI